jgi:hypothetical protein
MATNGIEAMAVEAQPLEHLATTTSPAIGCCLKTQIAIAIVVFLLGASRGPVRPHRPRGRRLRVDVFVRLFTEDSLVVRHVDPVTALLFRAALLS